MFLFFIANNPCQYFVPYKPQLKDNFPPCDEEAYNIKFYVNLGH